MQSSLLSAKRASQAATKIVPKCAINLLIKNFRVPKKVQQSSGMSSKVESAVGFSTTSAELAQGW